MNDDIDGYLDLSWRGKKNKKPKYTEYPPRNDTNDFVNEYILGVHKDGIHPGTRVDWESFQKGGDWGQMEFCEKCETAYPAHLGAVCPNCGRRKW